MPPSSPAAVLHRRLRRSIKMSDNLRRVANGVAGCVIEEHRRVRMERNVSVMRVTIPASLALAVAVAPGLSAARSGSPDADVRTVAGNRVEAIAAAERLARWQLDHLPAAPAGTAPGRPVGSPPLNPALLQFVR